MTSNATPARPLAGGSPGDRRPGSGAVVRLNDAETEDLRLRLIH